MQSFSQSKELLQKIKSSSHNSQSQGRKSPDNSELKLVSCLSQSKYKVFLALSPRQRKHFAVKVFPLTEDKVSKSFLRECRLLTLKHPNIVSIVETHSKQKILYKQKEIYVSQLIMELASFGDFADLIAKKGLASSDDTLARTYFHQLVNGIEFLHTNGIAHLDIKPENLLIGDDYNLKITDFDSCYMKNDHLANRKGTKNYRAPEVIS